MAELKETKETKEIKESLIAEIGMRLEDGIIEKSNADLLIKLIKNVEDSNEAINIAALGTTYKRTGFHFDKRLEKLGDTIHYFKKDETLSFSDESDKSSGKKTHKLIIGDNYDALQNLLIEYKGKIDVIYIDPPYGKDSMGEFAETNYDNAITRDNLLSMLYNRIVLARELLSDEGVIFCSIDDRNEAYVKCLFDEVFGENNFITAFHWEKTQHFGRQKINFYSNCEYVLCYAKELRNQNVKKELLVERINENLTDAPLYNASNNAKELTFPIGKVKFNIKDGVYNKGTSTDYELLEPITIKDGINVNELKLKFKSRWQQSTIDEEVKNGTNFWIKSDKFAIRTIYGDEKKSNVAPRSLIFTNANNPLVATSRYGESVGTNENASNDIKAIFDEEVFDYSKPVSLIKYLISLYYDESSETHRDDITVLDFFAGSGTTGQAVAEMNKQDSGNRTFILVQLDENLINDSNNETIKNQIALCEKYNRPHKLHEITVERLKRVMTGSCYDGTSDFKWIEKNEPLGGSLDVLSIETIVDFDDSFGKSPFDVIDETLYGQVKLDTMDKIEWVCEHFEHTQKFEN